MLTACNEIELVIFLQNNQNQKAAAKAFLSRWHFYVQKWHKALVYLYSLQRNLFLIM